MTGTTWLGIPGPGSLSSLREALLSLAPGNPQLKSDAAAAAVSAAAMASTVGVGADAGGAGVDGLELWLERTHGRAHKITKLWKVTWECK